jgi:uncharacterized membrane protein (UPF0127 family)
MTHSLAGGGSGNVLAVATMPPRRISLPRLRAKWILETEAGQCAAWGIEPGRVLRLQQTDQDRS